MSKDYPEIGDLWEDEKGSYTYVVLAAPQTWDYYTPEHQRSDEFSCLDHTGRVETFDSCDFNKMKYIGSSEVDMNKLFDVKDCSKESDAKIILSMLLKKNPEMIDWAEKNFSYLLDEGEK